MTRLHLPAEPTEREFARTVASAADAEIQPEDVAALAQHLANSGERLAWDDTVPTCDVASTGGPGSLSTLLAPLWLRAGGVRVAKLAVPGRPAGAIDTFGTVPGYRVTLDTKSVRDVVYRCGYAHFLADQRFAPLDAALFRYRQERNKVAVPALAAASILAKKVAVGVTCFGLDIRVGASGNFGATREEARQNAAIIRSAASCLGIECVPFITEGNPPQPMIGRGESLVALAHELGFRSSLDDSSWLSEHTNDCREMARAVLASSAPGGAPIDAGSLSNEAAAQALASHLDAQGSSLQSLLDRVDDILGAERLPVHAVARGTFRIDLSAVRSAIVMRQSVETQTRFSDGGGVILHARPGSVVPEGALLASIRPPATGDHGLVQSIAAACHIQEPRFAEITQLKSAMEIVR